MVVPVWLVVLICAPLAGALLLYVSAYTMLGIAHSLDGLSHALAPFRTLGPWFDYVAATGVLVALVGACVLLA